MVLTPDFDLVIVAAGYQEGSAGMDSDTSNRAFIKISTRAVRVVERERESTFMLFKSVYQDTHAVVP